MGNIKTNEVLNNLKFKIIFKKHDDLINLELFSKNLRNKTHLNGVWEQMILNNSKISFRNIKNNKIYYLTIFSGNLDEKNIFTPLNLYFNDKIPNGEYDISLEADKLYELIFGLNRNEKQLENFKIKIIDNLIIE